MRGQRGIPLASLRLTTLLWWLQTFESRRRVESVRLPVPQIVVRMKGHAASQIAQSLFGGARLDETIWRSFVEVG